MAQPLTEMEGTWEELARHASSFRGHRLRLTVLPQDEPSTPAEQRQSLSQKLAAIREQDAGAWDDVPVDLAEQHDHYVYGWPRCPFRHLPGRLVRVAGPIRG